MSKHRIVSLIASATEIACALGFEDALVGRSHECDYPASVGRLPVCTAPRFDIHGTSREIDDRVKATLREQALHEAASVYRVDAELLKTLRPDVILTQTQCEVCAVSARDVEKALCSWIDSRPVLVSLTPNSLADVWADIERVAEALAAAERGRRLVAELKARMEAVTARTQYFRPRPTVACLEWLDPLMAGGNWVPELVEMAGGDNLFGEAGKHSPWMTWDDLRRRDPDVIVALPCGFDLERTSAEMPAVEKLDGWSELKAVRTGRVYVTDGNQFFNRPGPRLVESLEIFAEMFHPCLRFGHEGAGWKRR